MFSRADREAIKKQSFLEQLIGMMVDDPRIAIVSGDMDGAQCELCGEGVDFGYALTWTEQRGENFYFGRWSVHCSCYDELVHGKG